MKKEIIVKRQIAIIRKKIGKILLTFILAEENLLSLRDEKSCYRVGEVSHNLKTKKIITRTAPLNLKKYFSSSEFQFGLKCSSVVLFLFTLTIRPAFADNKETIKKSRLTIWKKFFVEYLSYNAWRNYFSQKHEYSNLARMGLIVSGFVMGCVITTIVEMSFSSIALYLCQDNVSMLSELNISLQETVEMLIFKYKQSRDRHFRTYEDLTFIYNLLKLSSLKSGIDIPVELPPPPLYDLQLPNNRT